VALKYEIDYTKKKYCNKLVSIRWELSMQKTTFLELEIEKKFEDG